MLLCVNLCDLCGKNKNFKLDKYLQRGIIKSESLLLLTAIIWGFAFVAQRMGMDHIGPFLFNALRFSIGALTLIIIRWIYLRWFRKDEIKGIQWNKDAIFSGLILGLFLFGGATLQQVGIVYTTAGNAGFITGFYIILVPIVGLFAGHKAGFNLWIGALLALIGMYFLSVSSDFHFSKGDFLVFAGAIFWTFHVVLTGKYTHKHSLFLLAVTQYLVCTILSLLSAIIFEEIVFENILSASIPVLYGGILSVGVAFTLQILGQRGTPPAHAAIIMSMEAVFAVIGGMLILDEQLTARIVTGCILMLAGMIVAQLNIKKI